MKPPLKPGAFNFYRELPKKAGCRACKNNKMGICKLVGKEVPLGYQNANRVPKWCKLKDKNGGNEW